MKMKIYIAGSFATRKGVKRVLKLQKALGKAGFEVLKQLEAFDYTKIETLEGNWNWARKL